MASHRSIKACRFVAKLRKLGRIPHVTYPPERLYSDDNRKIMAKARLAVKLPRIK